MVENQTSSGSSRGRYRLGSGRRLKKGVEFRRVFDAKLSSADQRLIVYARKNELSYCRIGISVSRKVGSAVRRNRYKRQLREAFRLLQYELPGGYDYVLIPRGREEISTEGYRKSLLELGRRIHNRSKNT